MPRRTRPSYRLPPTNGRELSKAKEPKKIQSDSEDELSAEGESEVDADGPRVAIWEEEDEGFLPEQTSDKNRLRNDVPLGALRRAQEQLKGAVAESESESEISGEERRVEWSTKRVGGAGRRNKHGPVETTAKKPVTRKRMVVDVPKRNARDPRFEGRFETNKFEQSYGFLAERRETELQVLRESLTKARKMVGCSGTEGRSEREEEVSRLERAVKRSESVVNRDRSARMEQEALKGKRFLKKSERRELLVRARYTMHAKDGTLNKAIARRLRKTGQNEKRSRPRA